MVQYEDGTKKEVFLTEDMISSYDLLQLKQAGEHTFKATVFNRVIEITVKAVQKTITGITLSDLEGVYNGKEYKVEVQGELPIGAKVEYPQGNSFVNAGMYVVTAVVSCENYETLYLSSTVKINKAVYDLSSFTFEDKTVTYDGEDQQLALIGTVPEGLKYYYTISDVATTNPTDEKINKAKNAGVYYVTLHLQGDQKNYSTENLTITKVLTIQKLEIEMDVHDIHMDDMTVDYDGQVHGIKVDETKLPAGVTVEYRNNNQIYAGVYTVTAIFTLEENRNHTIKGSLTATLTIRKVDFDMKSIKMEDKSFMYDAKSHSIYCTSELPKGLEIEYYENNNQYKAGEYNVICHFIVTDVNYNDVEPISAKMTIEKASFKETNFSMNSGVYSYDGSYRSVTLKGEIPSGVQVTYKVWNEDNIDMAGITKFKEVGTYTIVVEFAFEKENYTEWHEIPSISAQVIITRREFDKNTQLDISDKEFTYDGTNQGTSDTIQLEPWITIRKFTLLDEFGEEINEAVVSGTYFYYYTFEYYDGIDNIVADSSTGKITIKPVEMVLNKNYFLPKCVTETQFYNGDKFDIHITFDESIYTEEVIEDVDYSIITPATATEVCEVGNYSIQFDFKNSKNYTFDTSVRYATAVIQKALIDCSNINVITEAQVDYDYEEVYPEIQNLPQNVIPVFTLKSENMSVYNMHYTRNYTVSFKAAENYSLINEPVNVQASVTVKTIRVDNSNKTFAIEDGETTYNVPNASSYVTQNLYSGTGTTALPISEDLSYNGSPLYKYSITANGNTVRLYNVLGKELNSEKFFEDNITVSASIYYVPLNKKYGYLLSSLTELKDIHNYNLLIDSSSDAYNESMGNLKFDVNDGTPYGTYYIYYTFTPNVKYYNTQGNVKGVTVVEVNQATFDFEKNFPKQTLEWISETTSPNPYRYDVESLIDKLDRGITIDYTKSTLNTNYSEKKIKIFCKLNRSIYGFESIEVNPTLEIVDRTIDLAKVSLNYKTIIYDENNHQNDFGNLDLFTNVPDVLKDLVMDGSVELSFNTRNGQEALLPGNYGVMGIFTARAAHLSIINSSIVDKSPYVYSILIIQAKILTESSILEAARDASISYTDSPNQTRYSIATTLTELEKKQGYVNGLEYSFAVNEEGMQNKIFFNRGESNGNYITPVAGLVLTSIDETNDLGDVVYNTYMNNANFKNDFILKASSKEEYLKLLDTPIYEKYYVYHFSFDSATSMKGSTAKSYDLYIKVTIICVKTSNDKINLTYNGFGQTLSLDNQEELNRFFTYKYKKGDGEISNIVTKVAEIGTYHFTIYCYLFDGDNQEVLANVIERDISINKIIIENISFDKYLITEMDYTNEDISVFNLVPGYNFPNHVSISSYRETKDEAGSPYPFFKRDIGTYHVIITLYIDDNIHYELASQAMEYEYDFTITKAHVIGYLTMNDQNLETGDKFCYLEDNPTISFYVEKTIANDFYNATYNYRLSGDSAYINPTFTGEVISIKDIGTYFVKLNLTIASQFKDKVSIGYYNDQNVWVECSKEVDKITIGRKIDLSKINATVNGVEATGEEMGVVYGSENEPTITIFKEAKVKYNPNGYEINFGVSTSYYKLTMKTLTDEIYGKFGYGETSTNTIIAVDDTQNIYKLSALDFAPGEYWIAFDHDKSVAQLNEYYLDGDSHNTYFGIHLIIE